MEAWRKRRPSISTPIVPEKAKPGGDRRIQLEAVIRTVQSHAYPRNKTHGIGFPFIRHPLRPVESPLGATHLLESRMREIRPSGSGEGAGSNPVPISSWSSFWKSASVAFKMNMLK